MPAPIRALIAGAQPKRVLANVLPVAGGAIAAQLGGALLKQIDQVEEFAAGGELQEAVVDLAGGLVIDAGIVAAVGATQGAAAAQKVAPLLVVGTAVSAFAPFAAPYIADGIEAVVGLVAGDKVAALPAPAAPQKALAARNGVARPQVVNMIRQPGGLYDMAPGGLYDMAAF